MYHLFLWDYEDGEQFLGSFPDLVTVWAELGGDERNETRSGGSALLRVVNAEGGLEEYACFTTEALRHLDDVQGNVVGYGFKRDDEWLLLRERVVYRYGVPVPPGHVYRFDGAASRVMTQAEAYEIERRIREALARGERTVVYPNGMTGNIFIGTGLGGW